MIPEPPSLPHSKYAIGSRGGGGVSNVQEQVHLARPRGQGSGMELFRLPLPTPATYLKAKADGGEDAES